MSSGQGFGGEGLLPPPPGVTRNFINPVSQSGHLIVAGIICPILAAVFVAGRCASKALSGSWGWDDYASFIGLAFSITLSAISVVPAKRYGVGRHVWDVPQTWLTPFLKYTYAQTLVYVIGLYFVKLSLLILFYRTFGVNRRFRLALYSVVGLWTTYVAINTPVIIFQCTPVHKAWNPEVNGHCLDLVKLGVSSGYINIVTDSLIFILPIPMIWSLHLSPRIKLAITAIFATGIFVIVTTIVRQIEVVKTVDSTDSTWFTSNSLMWLVIEVNVSIICGCMPTLKPLLRKTTWRGESKTSQAYKYNYKSHTVPKVPNPLKSNDDTLMDASYIELGPSGTNRDVHIAADDSPIKQPWLDQGNGRIVKTDTFGQVVHYKGREDCV